MHNIWQYVFWKKTKKKEDKYIYLYTGTQRYCIFGALASRGLKNKCISTKPFFYLFVLSKQATIYIYISVSTKNTLWGKGSDWKHSGFKRGEKTLKKKKKKKKKSHTSEQSASFCTES